MSIANPDVTVTVDNQSEINIEDLDHWGDVVAATLVGEGVRFGHVDLMFVDAETMSQLNIEHMGGSGPTDVLAFPLDAPQLVDGQLEASTVEPNGPPVHLGDVVLCPQVCVSQAADHVGSVDGEYCLLAIHAALHLLGYDHALTDERRAMQARERIHLAEFGFRHPVEEST